MTEDQLKEQRRKKWRLDGRPLQTLEEAREFIESVGFCLMYPLRPAVLAPTFMGAYLGTDQNLPTWQQVFSDPRTVVASEMTFRLIRERSAYESNLYGKTNFLLAGSLFPFYYALVGDRNPQRLSKVAKESGRGKLSSLAADVFNAIERHGPVTTRKFGELVGGNLSDAALDRALNQLWSSVMIARVGYSPEEGSSWDIVQRWSPEAVKEGTKLSTGEAVSALVSKYLDCVIAAQPQEIEDFFSPMVARSRVKEAVNALLAARELDFIHSGERTLVHLTPLPSAADKFPRVHHVLEKETSQAGKRNFNKNFAANKRVRKAGNDG